MPFFVREFTNSCICSAGPDIVQDSLELWHATCISDGSNGSTYKVERCVSLVDSIMLYITADKIKQDY